MAETKKTLRYLGPLGGVSVPHEYGVILVRRGGAGEFPAEVAARLLKQNPESWSEVGPAPAEPSEAKTEETPAP